MIWAPQAAAARARVPGTGRWASSARCWARGAWLASGCGCTKAARPRPRARLLRWAMRHTGRAAALRVRRLVGIPHSLLTHRSRFGFPFLYKVGGKPAGGFRRGAGKPCIGAKGNPESGFPASGLQRQAGLGCPLVAERTARSPRQPGWIDWDGSGAGKWQSC